MAPSQPGRWSKLFGGRRPRAKAKARPGGPFFRPNFEHLEDRIAPATYLWTGAGPNAFWNDASNWTLNGAAAVPVTNGTADLLFPGGAAQITTSNNNFAAASSFHSLTIDAANYTLNGNSITLGAGGLTVNSAAGSGSDNVNLPIVLGASTAITDTYAGVSLQLNAVDTGSAASRFVLTVGGSGSVTVPNGITDGGALLKTGPGTLVVTSTSTYTGTTTVNAGVLQLAANATLGSSVVVGSGATLQLAAGAILNQPLTLNGSGVGGGFVNSTAAALEAQGTSTVNGAITLGSDASIGVDAGTLTVNINPVALAGHILTVNAASGATATFIKALTGGVANAGSLVVNSALTGGTVTLNAASTFTGTTTVAGGTLDLGLFGTLVSNNITVTQGAALQLDNTSSTLGSRIPSAAASTVSLDGGTLILLSGANAVTETANAIRLTGGQSNIRINQGGAAMPTVLHAGSLIRSPGATVNFSSSNNNLGTANDEALFTTAPATTPVANGSGNLLPYVTVGGTDLATYGANGVAAFTGYIVNPTTFTTGTDNTDVVEYTSSATLPTPTSGLTVSYAGLVVNGGATLTVPVGLNLNLASGGLLLNHGSIVPAGLLGGNMTFSAEGVIYSNASAGANSISTQITGSHGMDLAGPALSAASTANYLYLNPGTARNTWTGGTWLDSANVGLAGTNPLGATTLTIAGGALTTATGPGAAAQISGATLSNAIVLAAANTTLNANNLTLSGTIGLAGNSVLTVLQPVTLTGIVSNNQPASPGGFVKLGSSALTLSPGLGRLNNTYTGSSVVGAGTLALATTGNPLGSGSLVLTGTAASATTLQNTISGISLVNALVLSNPAPAAGSSNVTLTGPNFTFARPVTLTGLTALQVNTTVTMTGAIGGTGGFTQSGSGSLVLSGNNGYSGATMLTGGSRLTINGSQPNSPVAVINGTLSGMGTTGFLTVGPAGTAIPSNPAATPAAKGVLTTSGANFSEGGDLTLQIAGYTAAGTDYGSLNLGSGPLVVGGNAATAPSVLTLDLSGLSSTNVAPGAIVYGNPLGTVPSFVQLNIINNPNDYAASVNYTATALNVILTAAINTKADLAPKTTDIWTGASTTTNRWSDPLNWLANAIPKKNDDLVFPAGAAQHTNIDDLASGIALNSITIEAGGYTLNPLNASSSITLAAGLTTTEPPDASANPLPTTVTVNIPIALAGVAATTFLSTYPGTTLVLAGNIAINGSDLVVDGSGTTTVFGLISDVSGVTSVGGVVKNGTGTLNLWPASGTGSTYTGVTTLNAGITTINDATSLGANAGTIEGTTINPGATLETVGSNPLTLAEPLTIAGTGVGGGVPGTSLGAIDVNNTGVLNLTGGINLQGDATIDNPNASTQLNINATAIVLDSGSGSGSALTLNTAGAANITVPIKGSIGVTGDQLIINSGLTPGTGTAAKANLYNGFVSLTAASTYVGATFVDGGTLDLRGNATLASTNIQIGTDAASNAAGPLATFEIDDNLGTNIARIVGATPVLTFAGGRFLYNGAFNAASKEVVDHIVLLQGQSFVQMNPGPGSKATIELDADHITRDTGATIDFAGDRMGDNSKNIVLLTNSTPPALDSSNSIFPYATVTIPGLPQTYATFTEVGSSKTYQIVPFNGYVTNPALFTGSVVGEVAAGSKFTVSSNMTLAALWVQGGGTVVIDPGATLELLSGLLTTGGGTAVIAPATPGDSTAVLTIGASFKDEGVIMSYAPTVLGTVISDDAIASAFIGLTYAGTNTVLLAPPADNTYTGDTYLASGTVVLETSNTPFGNPSPTTGGTLHFVSGVLGLDASASGLNSTSVSILNNVAMVNGNAEFLTNVAAGKTMHVFLGNSGAPATLALTGTNVLAVPQNVDVIINDQVTGTGNLTEVGGGAATGGGLLTLANAANTYSGGTVLSPSGIWAPTLLVTNATALGTGTLRLVGGTFEANTPVTIANNLDLESANVTLGGPAPNNGALTFSGAVTLSGVNNVVTTPNLFTVNTSLASVVYDNGPINGAIDGFTINQGFEVSNSFTLSQSTNLTGVQFGVDLFPGDTMSSVDWVISTGPTGDGVGDGAQPTGIIAAGTATTTTTFQSNLSGYDLDEITFPLGVTLAPGTYYLSLQNAVATNGDPAYWDENNGPSTAYESVIGNLANFDVPNTTGSESFQLFSAPSVPTPVVISGNISGSGALNVSGTIILSGAKSTQTGFSAATPGPLEIDGSQPSSPVPVTMATLDGNGTAGTLAVGSGGVVEPGTPSAVGELTAAGANFSDNGTLHLRIPGTTTPGTNYDVLDLSGGTLVVGGSSTLVLDLAGLSGITATTTVTGVILYGSPKPKFGTGVTGRIGNVPLFNQVQIINNPNNYAVELDYTTDPVSGQPELNLVIALGAPDAPTLNVPATPTTPEDVPVTFGSGLSVSDLEGAAPYSALFQLTVSIPASAGTLNFGPLTSVLIGTNQVLTDPPIGIGGESLFFLNGTLAGLTYNPADDFTGTFPLSLTVTNEGSSALLTGPQTVTTTVNVTVTPTSPAFALGPNEVVAFNAAGPNSFSFPGWATGIAAEPQPASWAGQTSLTFTTSSDNPGLFAIAPAVDPATGNLTFTLSNPLPPVLTAHVSVVLSEKEPDGDVDSSAPQTFTITATTAAPPTITDVIVHWGKEKASLLSMLNPFNAVSNPYGGRIDIPFANINAIDIQFSQSVSPNVAASALSVLGKFYGTYALSAPIFLNSYTLEYKLTGNVLGGTTAIGTHQPGEDDITLNFNGNAVTALGNGQHAGNFSKSFVVLVGDVNNDGVVDLYDQLAVARSLNIVDTGIPYLDVAGDGLIDMNDYNLVRKYTGNKIL